MTDAIVVDTCVLEHLFNPDWNGDEHIDRLLEKIARRGKQICMDTPNGTRKSRMLQEYEHRMQPFWKRATERGNCLQWLRYVIYQGQRLYAEVDLRDPLGCCVVPHLNRVNAERSDHIFVYVACALDSFMISNNHRHITSQRNQFCRCARRHGSNNTEFVNSVYAEQRI
jgi:hypothetical protein